MKLTYDPDHNVAYLRLREPTGEVESVRLSDEVIIDIAPDGRVCGIELLNANEQMQAADGGRFVVVDPTVGTERSIDLRPAART